MKKLGTMFVLVFSLLVNSFTISANFSNDIRVDEASIESGDQGPTLVIIGSFPAGMPLDVVLSSAGMSRMVLRERSDDGRKISIALKDHPRIDDTSLKVAVHMPGTSDPNDY